MNDIDELYKKSLLKEIRNNKKEFEKLKKTKVLDTLEMFCNFKKYEKSLEGLNQEKEKLKQEYSLKESLLDSKLKIILNSFQETQTRLDIMVENLTNIEFNEFIKEKKKNMALNPGDITASSGLAKRIYDNYVANTAACGFSNPIPAGAQSMLKAQAYCVAQAIVDEIQANAVASVIVSAGGLQTSTSAGNPTDPPGSPQTITGTVA